MARLRTVCGTEFQVDERFMWEYRHYRWTLLNSGYVSTTNWDKELKKPVTWTVHRMVMGKAPKGLVIDHVNNDKLDNRRNNLRFITQQENTRRANKPGTSGYRGVSWSRQKNRWRVRLCVSGREIHCGFFDDILKAAKAYDAKALELFGEFANLNFKEFKYATS
jgi:hypothetical protein